jgi:hypothetical protein
MKIKSNKLWLLKNKSQIMEFDTFPFAFRTMFNIVRKSIETKKPVNTDDLSIIGPPDVHGDRPIFSYIVATQKAKEWNTLTADGIINSKEFKRRQ